MPHARRPFARTQAPGGLLGLACMIMLAARWPGVAGGAPAQPGSLAPVPEARRYASMQPGSLAPWRGAWTLGPARPRSLFATVPGVTTPGVTTPGVTTPGVTTPVRQLGLGLGLAGTVTLGVGVGLLIQHRRGYAHFEAAPQNAGFVAALNASTSGAVMVGSGVGLATAAVTAGLAARDTGLWTEVGVGGAVALIGVAWYAREWPRVQRDLYGGSDSSGGVTGSLDGPDLAAQRRETASAAVLGAGTGLMLGAAVALLTRTLIRLHGGRGHRHGRGRGLTGGAGPRGAAGFQLHGRF